MPDVRLIDANALIKQIEETHCKDCNSYNGVMCRACTWMDAMDYIEDAPAVDAQPVKHGKWITTQKSIDDGFTTCSYCHREFYIDDLAHVGNEDGFCELCPNCGAKMDCDAD